MTSQDHLNTATQCATGTYERPPPLISLFGAVWEQGVIYTTGVWKMTTTVAVMMTIRMISECPSVFPKIAS